MRNLHNNRINSDWQIRCAPLLDGYASVRDIKMKENIEKRFTEL